MATKAPPWFFFVLCSGKDRGLALLFGELCSGCSGSLVAGTGASNLGFQALSGVLPHEPQTRVPGPGPVPCSALSPSKALGSIEQFKVFGPPEEPTKQGIKEAETDNEGSRPL